MKKLANDSNIIWTGITKIDLNHIFENILYDNVATEKYYYDIINLIVLLCIKMYMK